MKKRIVTFLLAAIMLMTCASAAGGGTGSSAYRNETTLTEGLTYTKELSYTTAGRRIETFTLENLPGASVYPIVMAADTIYGGFTVTQMINYAKSQGYNVVGAINSDFGYWDTRIPTGMVVENGIYKSSPEGNNALAFNDAGAFVSFMPEVDIKLENTTTGESLTTKHLNKSRADGGLYLYSEYFSTVSTRTSGEGWMVRFKVLNDGEISVTGTVELEVLELIEGDKAQSIGEDNLILTATAASELGAEFDKFHVGDKVTLTTACSDESLGEATWVSGTGNILVSEGQIYHSEWWDSTISSANPRTAVGIKADGSIVYHVMDGRTTASRGATLMELANDMLSMGCVYAVNMDGGGSSVMSVLMPGGSSPEVLNSPSDGTLRSVCTYILFVTDEPAAGAEKQLFIDKDGAYILPGANTELKYIATNSAMATVNTPSGVNATAALGSVANGVYTAGSAVGVDKITLSSANASGYGSMHIISTADSITVKDAETNSAAISAKLENGETLSLTATAKLNMRDVITTGVLPEYSVTGDIGSITPEGVFTAAGAPGAEGKIIVNFAGKTSEIPVAIAFEFTDMEGHWAESYVQDLYDKSIVNGATATTYAPEGGMKRGDFLLMLYRAAGQPEVTGGASFTDVTADAYYAAAIAWAEQNGIAQGTGDGKFDPEGTLIRQQGITFVYRALETLGVTHTDGEASALEKFTDSADVADWAVIPAATLVNMGVIEGADGKLDPGATLTRAQMAKILCATLYRS